MEVKQLHVYPFKSLEGIPLNECEVDEHGFVYDRLYMLASQDSDGVWEFISQRKEPIMARIQTELNGDKLLLKYGDDRVELPLDISEFDNMDLPLVEMELFRSPLRCKNIVNAVPNLKSFFSKFFIAADSRFANKLANGAVDGIIPNLAVLISDKRRVFGQNTLEREVTTNFQDVFPASLMTTASFDDLQRHVEFTDENAKISMSSFRMNMLVETDEPWIEDDWQKIMIGNEEWVEIAPCRRCTVPSVNQESGTIRDGKHPLPSLNKFRVLEKGESPSFGITLINVNAPIKVKVGDKITHCK